MKKEDILTFINNSNDIFEDLNISQGSFFHKNQNLNVKDLWVELISLYKLYLKDVRSEKYSFMVWLSRFAPDSKEKMFIFDFYREYKKSSTDALFHYLNKDYSLGEAQISMVKDFLSIKQKESLDYSPNVTVIKHDDNLKEEDIERIFGCFSLVSDFIPDKYEKNLPEIELVITEKFNSSSYSFDEETGKGFMTIQKTDNLVQQIGIVFHEYLHAIELANSLIKKFTNEYLIAHSTSMRVEESNGKFLMEGLFFSDKIREITGNDLTKPFGTEVLSVSGQIMITNPLEIFLADPVITLLFIKFIKGDL